VRYRSFAVFAAVVLLLISLNVVSNPVAASEAPLPSREGETNDPAVNTTDPGVGRTPSAQTPGPYTPPEADLTSDLALNGTDLASGMMAPSGSSVGIQTHTPSLPEWTYEDRDFNKKRDPINLVFNAPLSQVAAALKEQGWLGPLVTCQWSESVFYNNQWYDTAAGYYRDGWCGGSRRHIRLFELGPSLVVGSPHWDHAHCDPAGCHHPHDFEVTEEFIAQQFRFTNSNAWYVNEDDHVSFNSIPPGEQYNDGWSTQIFKQSGIKVNLVNGVAEILFAIPGFATIRDTTKTSEPHTSHELVVLSADIPVYWAVWHSGSYTQGTVPAGYAQASIYIPHWKSFVISVWNVVSGYPAKQGLLMCRENDYNLGCLTFSGGRSARTDDGLLNYFLDLPNFGWVYDVEYDVDGMWIGSAGGSIEYSLWHEGSYSQGEVSPGSSTTITFPRSKLFVVSIWRAQGSRAFNGWVFCREQSAWLGCVPIETGLVANVANNVLEKLVDISSLGGVSDTGQYTDHNSHKVRYFSNGGAVEYSLWDAFQYLSGHAFPNQPADVTFAHYRSFFASVWRYDRMSWLLCRENDWTWGCVQLRWYP